MRVSRFTVLASAALACSFFATTPLTSWAIVQSSDQTTAPDNSRQNKAQQPTADNQAHGTSDRQTTAQIRKAIMADKSLSTYAHNVKVITVNGAVTLKGPVSSDDEKQKVASAAASVVSPDKVTNDLTVKQ